MPLPVAHSDKDPVVLLPRGRPVMADASIDLGERLKKIERSGAQDKMCPFAISHLSAPIYGPHCMEGTTFSHIFLIFPCYYPEKLLCVLNVRRKTV